jgi:hypothetical protein
MPILGVPASLGKPEQLSDSAGGQSCTPLENGNAMLGKAVRCRYCPATVSDVRPDPAKPLPQGGKVRGVGSPSQETGRAAALHVPLPRGRRMV